MLHPTPPTAHAPEHTRPAHTSHPAQRVQVIERWNQWVRVRFAETGEETWVDLAETPFAPTTPGSEENKSENHPPHKPHPSDNGE